MYRIILECDGVPRLPGEEAARSITEEFRLHYPHEHNVVCRFEGTTLTLSAENDYDPVGLNLTDEFSDLITASIVAGFDGTIRVVSVQTID